MLPALALVLLVTACATAPVPVPGKRQTPAEEHGEPASSSGATPAPTPPSSDLEELPEEEPIREERTPAGGYEVVQVLYVTDRKVTGSDRPAERFGAERGSVRYGRCVVSIPEGHRRGRIEGPAWWRLQFRKRPDRHVFLLAQVEIQDEQFFDTLRQSSSDTFVFVHGFNVTFEDAVRQTAQLAYDLRFPGIPIAYSWPSGGAWTPPGYTSDEGNVAWTVDHLKSFLHGLLAASTGRKVHLLAHGMGSRALAEGLAGIARRLPEHRFSQVVLTAPDIDTDIFKRDIAPLLAKTARRVTLYASSVDDSLTYSKTVDPRRRVGESGPGLIAYPGIDTIDISPVGNSLVGYAHFAAPEALIKDLAAVLNHGFAPGARNLHRRRLRSGTCWSLGP